MIELPDYAVPNGAEPALIDYGMNLRPATGAAVQRVDRKGSRYRAEISLPPMKPERSRVVVSRLVRAKSEGIRIPYPLLEAQGAPGSPVVDGAGQAGTSLAIRGLNVGYSLKEGYWLSIEDADGQHYLHNCGSNVRVGSDGLATITITPALRVPFADGAAIHLAVPMIEGFVDGEAWSWAVPVNRLIAVSFPLEEVA